MFEIYDVCNNINDIMRVYKIGKCISQNTKQTVYQYRSIPAYAPRRSIIITPSTPLCDDIRSIVSSISAAVDSVLVATILLYVGEMSL